ncbi:unnamed protein product [Didymodactylos carnosus]|uniref:Ribosomal RNA methyltransferase FtsJ domain-containing protein n=1 Tax=Didymodactylos carnosus TaxID=1234261 RepID=A0A8S2U0A8_9BILA|nr:unnamed protein product [Didymodactylos carnosus]CAF4316849.1 unnamed protein product [Didymodactylos carnosus]
MAGRVHLAGRKIELPSELLSIETQLFVSGQKRFVSRGGEKLLAAIKAFGIDFNNQTVLDVGASTGGFTDCALQHGAKKVIALDVGTNQLS